MTVAAVLAIAVAVVLTLGRSPLVVAGTNSIPYEAVVGSTKGPAQTCQGGEVVPRGTTAVRMWLQANIKPLTRVTVFDGGRTLARGTQTGGWLGKVTTVPITPIGHTLRDARICFSIDRAVQAVNLLGGRAGQPRHGQAQSKMRIEYLRPSPQTWWSQIGSVAWQLGLGRAPEGGWAVALPLLLMAAATILVLVTLLRRLGRVPPESEQRAGRHRPIPPIAGAQTTLPGAEQASAEGVAAATHRTGRPGVRRRMLRAPLRLAPATAWVCAAVAFLSAASWSILSAPFQAPDEPSHFSYAQILAETGALPELDTSLN